MTTGIPEQIAHLDFTPENDADEDTSLLKECGARIKDTKEDCIRPARWLGVYRCCNSGMHCCDYHKKLGLKWGQWYCRKCKKTRNGEWMRWSKL